ncbi:MAG: alpha-galactosidase [Clostridia bacterium]|nr:alpha-galactosidase [Clostridia bacterium]
MFETILRVPDNVMIDGQNADRNNISSDCFTANGVTVRTLPEAEGLSVLVQADGTPVSRIRLRWRFSEKLRGQVLGDAWERAYADLEWKNISPWQTLPWYILVSRGPETVGYGVMTRSGAICSWQADPEGITLKLDVRCGGTGVELNGRTLRAAVMVSEVYEGMSAFAAACAFCRRMCLDPVLPKQPVYGANNWYYAYGRSSREDILADAGYLAKLTEGVTNRPFMVIDDGWQQGRYKADGSYENIYNGGPWLPNSRFGDMGTLAAEIRERNVLPGIWVRLLQDDLSGLPDAWKLPAGGLDPSVPGVLELVRETVSRIGGWGYRLLKHDFSTFDVTGKWGVEMGWEMASDGWHFADRTRTTAEIITGFYEAVFEAARPFGMLILGCNTVGHLGAGLMHMNRTGDDTSGLMWERTLRFGVNTLAFRMPQHGAFYDTDADCMGITAGIPWEFNRQWGRLLSLSGTSMFVSVKPGSLPESQEAELARMLRDNAVRCPAAEPLDWQENGLPQEWLLDGRKESFHWYEPGGLRVGCANGPVWEQVWREVSAVLDKYNAE